MGTTPSPSTPGKRPVEVYVDHDCAQQDHDKFHLCPLGVQFYAPRPLQEFTVLELDLDVPAADGNTEKVTCRGAVVRCELEKARQRYRVWIKFLDLPAETSERIRCASKNGEHLCSYCENF